jgi:hypothetical protein
MCYGGIKTRLFLDLGPLQLPIICHDCYNHIKHLLRRGKGDSDNLVELGLFPSAFHGIQRPIAVRKCWVEKKRLIIMRELYPT